MALAALGAVSAAWTVGIADEALRWGLVAFAYAAVAFAAAVLVRGRREATLAAALIALLAAGLAVVGLVAAAQADPPLAHRQAGLWRPASTFQYAPALALLVVSALPAYLAAMAARRSWLAVAGALGGAIGGATLGLAASRTQLAFAVVVCGALLWRPGGRDRGRLAAATALIAAAGLGAYAVAGGYVPKTPPPDGTERLLLAGLVVALATAAWAAARRAPWAAAAVALLTAGAVAAAAKPAPRIISSGLVAAPAKHAPGRTAAPPRRLHTVRDRLLHGRLRIWQEALETFADRPLYGGGADSYLFASADHQSTNTVYFAHDLPLELAAELGVAGLLLALGFYGTAGVALWRGRSGPAAWLLGPAAAAFLAANLVDWPWHLAGSGSVWALAMGAILASGRRNSDPPLGLSRACQGTKETA